MTNPQVRTAVVVGASSGVGRAAAMDLARNGWRVVLMARRHSLLQDLAAEIRGIGGTVDLRSVDVAAWSEGDTMWVRGALAGSEDVALVHAAGVFGPVGLVGDVSIDEWRQTIGANLVGAFAAASAVMPSIRERRRGRMIFVSSAQTLHAPDPVVTGYATSKYALNFLVASLASELEGSDAAAACVHPGDLKTEMWAAIAESAAASGEVGEQLQRWAQSVGTSGGDSMDGAVGVIRRALTDPPGGINGMFLMPLTSGAVTHPGSGDRRLWG